MAAATAPAKEVVYEEASKNPPKDQLHLKKLSDYKTLSKVPHIFCNVLLGNFKAPIVSSSLPGSYGCRSSDGKLRSAAPGFFIGQ